MNHPPAYWQALCCRLLHAAPRLAQELWQAYTCMYPWTMTTLRFELDRVVGSAPTVLVEEQRIQRCRELVTPEMLFEASIQLSPEGRPRRRDVVELEEAILHYTTATGQWK